jgi:hypothetical protein
VRLRLSLLNNDGLSVRLLKNRGGDGRNQSAAMKRVATILFSLVLVYGGVAWTLGKCLSHESQHGHSIEHRESHTHDATILNDSRDSSALVIHCPTAEMRIGPTAQSGPSHLSRWNGVTTVHAHSFYKPASPTFRNSLWLDAVFRRILAFSYLDDLGRHLFFSVLQI